MVAGPISCDAGWRRLRRVVTESGLGFLNWRGYWVMDTSVEAAVKDSEVQDTGLLRWYIWGMLYYCALSEEFAQTRVMTVRRNYCCPGAVGVFEECSIQKKFAWIWVCLADSCAMGGSLAASDQEATRNFSDAGVVLRIIC